MSLSFFLLRSFEFTHETVRDWQERFAPIFAAQLRASVRVKWVRPGTSMKPIFGVIGKWCYLYRAIDRDGNLVDSMLSEKRDMVAEQAFFTRCARCDG